MSASRGRLGAQIQSTRPQTLSYGLTDSPVGQLAWIVEKFQAWTHGSQVPEDAVDRDVMLTNVMLDWLTRTAGSSANIYYEGAHAGQWPEPNPAPTGVAVFAEDIAIRRYARAEPQHRAVVGVRPGRPLRRHGGPDLLVADVRAFFRGLRAP